MQLLLVIMPLVVVVDQCLLFNGCIQQRGVNKPEKKPDFSMEAGEVRESTF